MADQSEIDTIHTAIRNADAAGDGNAVRQLAAHLNTITNSTPAPVPVQAAPTETRSPFANWVLRNTGESQTVRDIKNPQPPQAPEQSFGSTLGKALVNFPGSVINQVKGAYHAITNPVETAKGLVDVGVGGWENALKHVVGQPTLDRLNLSPERMQKSEQFSKYMVDHFGTADGLRKSFEEDPASVLSMLSLGLTGGGSAVAQLPKLEQVGKAISTVGKNVDPLLNTARVIGGAKDLVKGTAGLATGMTSGTGIVPIKSAYEAGSGTMTGQPTNFQAHMRESVPKTDILNDVSGNLAKMGKAKSDAYKTNMASVGKSESILSFDGIDEAIANTDTAYKGQVINKKASEATQAIRQAVEEWKALGAEYHTPEGMDAFKRKIGGLVEEIPHTDLTARRVGDSVYHAVKNEIVKQAPEYAKAMKDYSEATDLIHEIKMTLSHNPKASVDTQMRKLQSLTRNNVNTNYGNRLDLVNQMTEAGGTNILPAVSGQALSSWTPRGLASASALPTAAGAGYLLGGPAGAALLAMSSPRLMGETAYYTGKLAGAIRNPMDKVGNILRDKGVDPYTLGNALSQMNQQQRGNK